MTKRVARTPPLVCTGYELTNALRRYLEVGHGVDFDEEIATAIEEDKELRGDAYDEADEVALAPQRAAGVVKSCQQHFSRVREGAPAEDRKVLEIPYSYGKWAGDHRKVYLFVPTGAYINEDGTSGVLKTPREKDLKAIQAFIDAANSLLPEAVRDEASLKLEDLRFEVHTPRSLLQPAYKRDERKVCEILLQSMHAILGQDGKRWYWARATEAARDHRVRVATALSRDRWAELKPAEGECT